ncbi:two-component system sensor histidine kinase AfsQ2 [Actinomadura vinacea]|uniref:histidine kinase n=1 Tax=Actinomadura vinacea TaxID=115336 RepID=A0ABP5WDW4_9ACTN
MKAPHRARAVRAVRSGLAGLRVRLAAAFLAVALLAAVLVSGISYILVRRSILERTQEALLTEVEGTLSRMVPANLPAGSGLAYEIERALKPSPERKVLVLEMPGEGFPDFVGFADWAPEALVDREFAARTEHSLVFQRVVRGGTAYLLVGARVKVGEGRSVAAFVSLSLRREQADLRSFTSAVLVADAVALAFALALALLAAGGVLRPVRRLGRAARALGDGRLETRVEVRGGDELADLARTFNGTAEALERTVGELRAMEASARRFAADVSHELRTPLTAMVALTDVLAEEAAVSDDGRTAVRLVVGEILGLRELVEHLIEISRFDSGTASLVLDEVVLADAVAATLAARGWRGAEVEVDAPPGLSARLDPRRFDVVMANLVGNALGHGRPPVHVRARAAARSGCPGVEISVADQGPGIPEELLDLVFDRFVKADSARSRSAGSGLGLSIARANAALHGGVIEAANAPEGGAVFTLWMPLADEPEEGEGEAGGR